jgi:hypothetical protein
MTQSVQSSDGRSSRIMAVRARSPFFAITLVFVFAEIIIGDICVSLDLLPKWSSLVLLGLLLLSAVLTAIQARNPAFLPRFIASFANRVIDRIATAPAELGLVLGIIYLCVDQFIPGANPPSAPAWSTLVCTLLMMTAFLVCGTDSRGGGRNRRRSPAPVSEANLTAVTREREETPELLQERSEEADAEAAAAAEAWGLAQRQRWDSWIEEEVQRLHGQTAADADDWAEEQPA